MQKWIVLSLVVVAAAAHKTEHEPDPRCAEPLEVGTGTANQRRFYYSVTHHKCSQFQWKGGKKTGNNFKTLPACYITCHPCVQIAKRGSVDMTVPHYGFSKKENKCVNYTWPRCNPHGPTFSTLDDCLEYKDSSCSIYCSQLLKVGYPCYKRFGASFVQTRSSLSPRYYYSTESEQCKLFMYNGCGGNENNFRNKTDCQKQCSCRFSRRSA